jgi:hypothetical protein
MPVFTTNTQLYTVMEQLVSRIEVEYPQATEAMLKSKLVIRFNCQEPMGEITIDAGKRPLQIHYGSAPIKPELDITLPSDTLHQILLGNLTLAKALGSKQVQPKGPIWKVMSLAPLFDQAQKIYPQLL